MLVSGVGQFRLQHWLHTACVFDNRPDIPAGADGEPRDSVLLSQHHINQNFSQWLRNTAAHVPGRQMKLRHKSLNYQIQSAAFSRVLKCFVTIVTVSHWIKSFLRKRADKRTWSLYRNLNEASNVCFNLIQRIFHAQQRIFSIECWTFTLLLYLLSDVLCIRNLSEFE